MNNIGYNSTGDIPCHVNPTGNPTAMSTMTGTSFPGNKSLKLVKLND